MDSLTGPLQHLMQSIPPMLGTEGDAVHLSWPKLCEQSFEYRKGFLEAVFDVSMLAPEVLEDNPTVKALSSFCLYVIMQHSADILETKNAPRAVSPATRFAVFKRDNYRCRLCGVAAQDRTDVRLEVDHITPKSQGGPDSPENLWTLCRDCNRGKGVNTL